MTCRNGENKNKWSRWWCMRPKRYLGILNSIHLFWVMIKLTTLNYKLINNIYIFKKKKRKRDMMGIKEGGMLNLNQIRVDIYILARCLQQLEEELKTCIMPISSKSLFIHMYNFLHFLNLFQTHNRLYKQGMLCYKWH